MEGNLTPSRTWFRLRPTTRLGWWAVRLLVAFAAGLVVGMSLAAAGQIGGGEGSFDNLWLRVPLAGAGLTAVLAGVTAAFTIVRRGERSVLVFLPIIVGLFVAIFLLGEIGGHD
jgi:Fe2+ transport system protein B